MCSLWCPVCSHHITHYFPAAPHVTIFYVCFFPFWSNAVVRGPDRWPHGQPWVETSSGVAWFYLARCCLSPLATQPITSNSNVLLWKAACVLEALRGFFFFFFVMEMTIIKKKHVFLLLFLPLITLSHNKNNVSPLKILSTIGRSGAPFAWECT